MKRNLKKSILAIVLSIIMLSTYIMALGGSSLYDEELFLAKDITTMILDAEEGRVYASFLKGLNGDEDFILAYTNDGGYAVFSREDMQLLEYSKSGNPYAGINNNLSYYAGPTNYYEKNNSTFSDVMRGDALTALQATEIGNQLAIKIEENRLDKFIEIEDEELTLDVINPGNEIQSGPTGSNPVDVNAYKKHDINYIADKDYFLSKPIIPYNGYGTCTTIATQLLLGFNNWAMDGRLIRNHDFLYGRNGDNKSDHLETPLHQHTISTTDEFYLYLLEVIDPYGYSAEINRNKYVYNGTDKEGASLQDAYDGIEYYLNTCVEETVVFTINMDIELNGTTAYYTIKNEIDSDRPSLMSLEYFNEKGEEKHHAVVAYGYQTFIFYEDIDGIICHYGWGDDKVEVWVNKNWINGCLTFETTHEHDDTIIVDDGHILQCSICNRRKPTSQHDFSEYICKNNDDLYHYLKCSCGFELKESHGFLTYTIKKNPYLGHVITCPRGCGYKKEEGHDLSKYRDCCRLCGWGFI